jgi:hypothetical protein
MPKVTGAPIARFHGLDIYATLLPSKTGKGKERIWVHVRQAGQKQWRIAASLCYVNALDIRFEK